MSSLRPKSTVEIEPIPPDSSASRQESSAPASPSADAQNGHSLQSVAHNAVEERIGQNFNEQFEKLRRKIRRLGGVREAVDNAESTATNPGKAKILAKAIDRLTELEENIGDLSFINQILESRLQEHEEFQAGHALASTVAQSAISSSTSGCAAAPEVVNLGDSLLPQLQSGQAITEQQNVSKKRKATGSLGSERNDPVACECLACGFDLVCPKIELLTNQKDELESELERVRANAIAWLEERNRLIRLLFDDNEDQQQRQTQPTGADDKPPPENKMSVQRRARAWLVAIGILVGVKKKACGEEHQSTDRALVQLSKDVEGLELP
ncbi:hypothetical protein M409DRAFT_17352 [Zasmidium cellare ATCC 36951]|uniref:BHLH domain-containing protein n=1 Tax=Zasmidium cellare ATCC 36951 TaxID=1080233 RepID=A0A6A6D1R2_ZASCE|nr:uncharacterized protein M409DRAFT_17352 [Zasmidium cellare ATCC 36951]KAF2172112.1 hypothetical protein M409DRAFT_17352 [Zasmidium cellare ATCC 36951]